MPRVHVRRNMSYLINCTSAVNAETTTLSPTINTGQLPYGRRRTCWKKNSSSALAKGPLCRNIGVAGVITCAICGVERYYKFIKQTKKYGLNCCEPCRKFISVMIQNVNNNQNIHLTCVNKHLENCFINETQPKRDKCTTHKIPTSGRCKACWLSVCLNKYKMPASLKRNLALFLPQDKRPDLFEGDVNTSHKNKGQKCDQENKTAESSNPCLKGLCRNYLENCKLSNDSNEIVILRIKF